MGIRHGNVNFWPLRNAGAAIDAPYGDFSRLKRDDLLGVMGMQLRIGRRRTGMASSVVLLAIAALAVSGAWAQAPRSAADIAASVPVEVSEAAAGGSWADADKIGVYRGIVVVDGPADAPTAHVFVQWLGMKSDGGSTEVVKSVEIKDVADAKMTNASLSIEADREDEITILVTSYDADAKPSVMAFKASKPGVVAKTELPPSVQGQAGDKP